jgi:nucleotide-binding universal stress UspA family protein
MALDLSTDLAAKYDAQIILLHVVTHDDDVPRELYDKAERALMETESDNSNKGPAAPLLLRSKVLEHFGHKLLRSAQEFAKSKGVKQVETVIDDGAAGKRILHHAMSRSVDLIVMGSRGFGKLKELVLGSVSHNVFHLAPCSCATVHHTGTQSAFEGIKSILVATDGSEQADKAVDLASDIAARYGAKLSLVYVTSRGPSLETLRDSIDMSQLSEGARDELDPSKHPVAEHVSSAFIPPVVSSDTLREIGEQVLARGRQTSEAKGVSSTNTVLMDGDPARKILQVARREQADLITMGSRGLGGVEATLAGSVSYKVNHSAPCNCLIVR